MKIVSLLFGDDLNRFAIGENFHNKAHVCHICSFLDAGCLGFGEVRRVLPVDIVAESADDLVEGSCEALNF